MPLISKLSALVAVDQTTTHFCYKMIEVQNKSPFSTATTVFIRISSLQQITKKVRIELSHGSKPVRTDDINNANLYVVEHENV